MILPPKNPPSVFDWFECGTPIVYLLFKGSAPTTRAPGLCWQQLVGAVAFLAFIDQTKREVASQIAVVGSNDAYLQRLHELLHSQLTRKFERPDLL